MQVLLTGATGFVGSHLLPVLRDAGVRVVCASRDPSRHAARLGPSEVRQMDVGDRPSVLAAMKGCDAAYYLVHSVGQGRDYLETERRNAHTFASAAQEAGLGRIIYLGGVEPVRMSKHLQSRLEVGRILRECQTLTIELRAAMIIGAGSESWTIVRDLAARLPAMLLPRWLESRSQPIAIDDVVAALHHALHLELPHSAAFDLPGPETLSAREILQRTAALMDRQPRTMNLPWITPRLSSYWIRAVTRANPQVAEELVEGLYSDLVASGRSYWAQMPEHELRSFDEATRNALVADERTLPWHTRKLETMWQSMTRRALAQKHST